MQNPRRQIPTKQLANVSLPICQEFGFADCRTLSVVTDIPRKSPVTMRITMSIGVSTACPVMISPTVRNSTFTTFLATEFSV